MRPKPSSLTFSVARRWASTAAYAARRVGPPEGISPPLLADPGIASLNTKFWFLSEDLPKAVVDTNAPRHRRQSLGGSWGLYLQDNATPAENHQLLTDPASPLPDVEGAQFPFEFAGATKDLRHVVFHSIGRQLTPDGLATPTGRGVYEWSDGQVRFVSKLPSGEAVEAEGGSQTNGIQYYPGDHLVSDDGSRIYFTVGGGRGPLYVREHGSVTRPVSASLRAEDDPSVALPAVFQAAKAADGSEALFTSANRLTEDATGDGARSDLYLWKADAPVGQRLANLTTGDPAGGMCSTSRQRPMTCRTHTSSLAAIWPRSRSPDVRISMHGRRLPAFGSWQRWTSRTRLCGALLALKRRINSVTPVSAETGRGFCSLPVLA